MGEVFTMTPVYSSCDIDLKGARESQPGHSAITVDIAWLCLV